MKAAPFLFACLLLSGCAAPPAATVVPDEEVRALMARAGMEGSALAVTDRGQVRSVRTWGRRKVDRNLPLTPQTVMYGASLTRTVFARMLLQLVDEGRLDLGAPLPALLPRPQPACDSRPYDFSDLAGNERWRRPSPRIPLAHASGFANFRWVEPDRKPRFHVDPARATATRPRARRSRATSATAPAPPGRWTRRSRAGQGCGPASCAARD